MSRNAPGKPVKPPEGTPRKGRSREDPGNVRVDPLNPPAVGGGYMPAGRDGGAVSFAGPAGDNCRNVGSFTATWV
jgi:hypothetical protein